MMPLALHLFVSLASSILFLVAYKFLESEPKMVAVPMSRGDPSSFSNFEAFVVKNIELDWTVDFDSKAVSGSVALTVHPLSNDEDKNRLILDTRDLNISSVRVKDGGTVGQDGADLSFFVGDSHLAFGSALVIHIPERHRSSPFILVIEYSTTAACSALQWLTPQQTAGKVHPFLFSQCQAIHARSLLPCQDTPAVKAPYTAKVTAPACLTTLMSAIRDQNKSSSKDLFVQKIPIPSYLIAIVVGHLESRPIGPRSHVWAEPQLIEASAKEFTDTESFIATAEKLVGPYVWGIYDLLVLPPSFPYGGMENPCLTFVTPTLLAGDKSLANVVAHEISHSWTGNLVTNQNPEHFWLNEGHTVFLERKIVGRLFGGQAYRDFCALGGWNDLQYAVDLLGADSQLTSLNPKLDGIDPDDAFSSVPYEKGHTLLYYLEVRLGGPQVFEPFLLAYIERFKFKSITTSDWKNFLFEFFSPQPEKMKVLSSVDWETWFHSPGMPPVKPAFDTTLLDACSKLAKKWISAESVDGFDGSEFESLSSKQKVEFLAQMLLGPDAKITTEKVKKMEEVYHLNEVRNSEIRFRWLRLGLMAKWSDAIPRAIAMATEQGRMKFTRPLFRDLYAWEEARSKAISSFEIHRPNMHTTTAHLVAKDMHFD